MLKYSNLREDAANGGSAMEFVATSRGCSTMDVPASDCGVTNTETVRRTPLGSKFFKSMGRFLVCMVALFAFWASNNNAMAAYTGSGTAIDPWFIADGGGGSVYAYIEGSVLYIKYAGSGVSDMADFWCVDGNSPWWYSPKLNNIQSVDIQSGVTSIGSRAFMDCQYMQTVNIPQSVTKICAEAFKNCISVATFVIPCSINTIQGSAFEDCTNLKTVVNLAKTPQTIEYNPTSMCVLPMLSDPFPTYTSLYVQPSALSAFQSWASMFGGKVSALTNTSYGYLEPTAPTGITGTDTICLGSSTWLTVSGNFGSGAYQWYQGSCGGPYLGSVLSVNVTPTTTTTYYVRGVGISPCDDVTMTPCDSVTVYVDVPPTAPTDIDGITSINHGDSTELTAMGGSEGSGCIYQWYSDACGGTFIDTGITITVKPSINTTYYVRRIGNTACHSNPTACASVTVTVNYILTFDPQGGTVSPDSKNVIYDEEIGTMPVPERCGYEFDGWFTGRNGAGTEYTDATIYSTYSNTTVYAKWVGVTWEVGYPTASNITATFVNDNKLIISGMGNMQDWLLDEAPWNCIKDMVQTVVINSGIKSIGDYAFVNFSELDMIYIPHGVTRIGANSFQNCCSLYSINIPSSVGYIGDEAFASGDDCSLPLTDVTVNWTTPFAAPLNIFAGNDISTTNLHVPQGTECDYATATIWEDFVIANATRTITASSGSHGTISLSGVQNVNCGNDLQFIFTPDAPCYEIDQILVNGIDIPDSIPFGSYTFENVTANQTISVNFKIKSYIISATSDMNGSISPSGDTSILCGANQTFVFTPDYGYQIDSVFIDDEYEPTAVTDGYYTFANVGDIHTIEVTYAFNAHTIMVINGSNGSIMPTTGAVSVNHGGEATFTFTPDAPCYEIDQILVNGINEPDSIPFGSYTFENVTTDQTLTVNFKIRSYAITATAGANGSITPSGSVDVICGANQTFVFTPDYGYIIGSVYVDDISNATAAANGYYTFENVTGAHTIRVTFELDSYLITVASGSNGSVTPPAGMIYVKHGNSLSFTFTPDAPCYEIDQVLINGINQPSAVSSGSYDFTNITANQTVLVTFKIKSIDISAVADASGSISPSGDLMIVCGAEQTFTATPNACQEVDEWLVNGVPKQQGGATYTTVGIQEHDVVTVTFKRMVYTIEAIATSGGRIAPSGVQTVYCGGSMEFCFEADEDYIAERVFVDGSENSQALFDGCYNFSNVHENHSIFVVFQVYGVGIDEATIQPIKVYPNPTKNQLTIDNGQLTMDNIEIYTIVGQKVGAYSCGRQEMTIDVSHLANGMYFLKIDNKVVRFVKE